MRGALAGPLLVALVASVTALWTRSLWGDEVLSLEFASLGWPEFLATLRSDPHPPGYYLLLRAWTLVAGDGEVALRTFQGLQLFAFLGVGERFIRGRLEPAEGRIALGFLLLSAELWLLAPMLRYYVLAATLALVATDRYLAWLERGGVARGAGLALVYAALLYTDYPASSVLAVHAVHAGSRGRLGILAILAAAGLAFAPWVGHLFSQVQGLVDGSREAELSTGLRGAAIRLAYASYGLLFGETSLPFGPVMAACLVLLAGSLAWARPRWPAGPSAGRLALWTVVGGIAAVIVMTTWVSRATSFVYTPSRALFVLPFLAIAGASFLHRARRRRAAHAAFGLLVIANLYGISNLALNREQLVPVYHVPWREVVRELRDEAGLVVVDESHCYEYYRARSAGSFPRRIEPADLAELQAELEQGDIDRVIVLETGRDSTPSELAAEVLDHLRSEWHLVESRAYAVQDPRYRALKQRLLGRESYAAKLTRSTYERP